MLSGYSIRRFLPAEWELYRAIRLEALQLEPGMFGNSHALEAAFTNEQWQQGVAITNAARFGLYCGDELVGLTGIRIDSVDGEMAYMTQSYIRKEHRGKKLSRMLYEARIGWAKEHGLKLLTIGHRESNTASKAANQRYGFRYTHREPRNWPDGGVEDMVYYELAI